MPSSKHSAAGGSDRQRLLRHRHRVTRERGHHGGTHADARRLRTSERERRHRIHAHRVREPHLREAHRLGPACWAHGMKSGTPSLIGDARRQRLVSSET